MFVLRSLGRLFLGSSSGGSQEDLNSGLGGESSSAPYETGGSLKREVFELPLGSLLQVHRNSLIPISDDGNSANKNCTTMQVIFLNASLLLQRQTLLNENGHSTIIPHSYELVVTPIPNGSSSLNSSLANNPAKPLQIISQLNASQSEHFSVNNFQSKSSQFSSLNPLVFPLSSFAPSSASSKKSFPETHFSSIPHRRILKPSRGGQPEGEGTRFCWSDGNINYEFLIDGIPSSILESYLANTDGTKGNAANDYRNTLVSKPDILSRSKVTEPAMIEMFHLLLSQCFYETINGGKRYSEATETDLERLLIVIEEVPSSLKLKLQTEYHNNNIGNNMGIGKGDYSLLISNNQIMSDSASNKKKIPVKGKGLKSKNAKNNELPSESTKCNDYFDIEETNCIPLYPTGPQRPLQTISFQSDVARVYYFQRESHLFVPLHSNPVVAVITNEMEFEIWDNEVGILLHSQQIDPDATVHFDRAQCSFIWCYCFQMNIDSLPEASLPSSNPLEMDFGEKSQSVIETFNLRFTDPSSLLAISNAFGLACYQILNKDKNRMEDSDREYLLQHFNAPPPPPPDSDSDLDDSDEYDSDDSDSSESEDTEDDGVVRVVKPGQGSNRKMVVGYKHDRSFVSNAAGISVMRHTADDSIELAAQIAALTTSDGGKVVNPTQMMLHNQEQSLLMLDPTLKDAQQRIFKVDLERGQIVEEWNVGNCGGSVVGERQLSAIVPDAKFSQMTGCQTFVGMDSAALFRIDPRLSSQSKRVAEESKTYAVKSGFSCGATTGDGGGLVVGSENGEIRLFDRVGVRAKTLLPGFGDPIIGLDVTEGGRYIIATCKTYLLFFCTDAPSPTPSKGDKAHRNGFQVSLGSQKPTPLRLQLKPEHVAYMQKISNEMQKSEASIITDINNSNYNNGLIQVKNSASTSANGLLSNGRFSKNNTQYGLSMAATLDSSKGEGSSSSSSSRAFGPLGNSLVTTSASPISFTPARFSTSGSLSGGDEERAIISSTGPFVIIWNLRRVKLGHVHDYQIRRYADTVVADNFRFGQDRSIVVALPQHVTLLSKKSLSTPSPSALSSPKRRFHSNTSK